MSPLCQNFITLEQLNQMEPFYPLHAYVCESCFLTQLEEYVSPEAIFTEYAYFSSYTDSWLKHARNYTNLMIERFGITADNFVIELGSNDGYLLQYFLQKRIPVLGIEPAANVAQSAIEKGIPTLIRFFGEELACEMVSEGKGADLVIGNNVLAHVPNLNDFVKGIKILLKLSGVITMEFPHLMRLIEENQFDTISHEHFSYFSFISVDKIFTFHGLKIFDVEELTTHGGSLRIYASHIHDSTKSVERRVTELKRREETRGLKRLDYYNSFDETVKKTKRKILEFLIKAKQEGKSIVGYGAPGKGNTLLNYCGIRTDFIDYTVDRNYYKQGRFTPGTHIPVYHPDKIRETRPDYTFILPWNLKDEIMEQLAYVREWGGKFVVPIPELRVFS
jgi:C-methyltransferase C-terminal domain/Putative zinc binding domain/Methyltransferase domain